MKIPMSVPSVEKLIKIVHWLVKEFKKGNKICEKKRTTKRAMWWLIKLQEGVNTRNDRMKLTHVSHQTKHLYSKTKEVKLFVLVLNQLGTCDWFVHVRLSHIIHYHHAAKQTGACVFSVLFWFQICLHCLHKVD